MSKFFIILGVIFILIGAFWPLLKKINFGQLPGDIIIKGENTIFYFPVVTSIIISIILSLILWFFNKK